MHQCEACTRGIIIWLEHVHLCFRVSGLDSLELLLVFGIICRKGCCTRMQHLHMAPHAAHSNHLEQLCMLIRPTPWAGHTSKQVSSDGAWSVLCPSCVIEFHCSQVGTKGVLMQVGQQTHS